MLAAMTLTRRVGARAGHDWATIAGSTSELGRWQLTWWDAQGPVGHTCRDTARECVVEALRDGLEPGSAEGPDAALALALMQEEQAKRARMLAWLDDLDAQDEDVADVGHPDHERPAIACEASG